MTESPTPDAGKPDTKPLWGLMPWQWILAGAAYGLLVRGLFAAFPKATNGPMSVAFLVVTPVVVGALTVYGVRHRPPDLIDIVFRPWASVALMLVGCGLALFEGSICLAMMAPLFLACGSVGGILMAVLLKLSKGKNSHLPAVAVLPFLMMLGEGHVPLDERVMEVRQSVRVHAAPATVWGQILNARAIEPQELPFSLTHLIGVPRPLEGVNLATAGGEVRFSKWERGVNFRGLVTERRENEFIRWQYQFDSHSFPEGSMDEHVAIGGRYFDLHDTAFTLQPLPGGDTQLEIVAHYRVTSSINFYAVPAAALLGNDFVGTILGLYKRRSERVEPRPV
jgi:hypothetical protein